MGGPLTPPDPVSILASTLRLDNSPNPFGSATSIRFALPSAARIRMDVFDMAGRRVATPVETCWSGAGAHDVSFDTGGLPSGVYVCRLQVGDEFVTRRMLVIR
jgi:hypothetical protein